MDLDQLSKELLLKPMKDGTVETTGSFVIKTMGKALPTH